jgi:hypothetical protein
MKAQKMALFKHQLSLSADGVVQTPALAVD